MLVSAVSLTWQTYCTVDTVPKTVSSSRDGLTLQYLLYVNELQWCIRPYDSNHEYITVPDDRAKQMTVTYL